jgi:hypothetical protein
LYSKDKENFEEDISAAVESGEEIEEIKKDLLLLKQEFYKSLIPYIQLEKLRDFTRYVDSDLSYREKSNEVATQIEQKSILRDERLEEIEEQIQTNKDHLHAQIKEKVTLRVQNRLDVFIYQENFQSLPDISKIRIFERLITKIQEKRKKLENTPNSTSIVEETMILYEIVEEIFE